MSGVWHFADVVNPTERNENDPLAVSVRPSVVGTGLGAGRPATSKPRTSEPPSEADGTRELKDLILGVSLLAVALGIYWIGTNLPDHVATRTVVASFGAAGLIWVLHRFRVVQRPHGVLIASGVIALFAAVVPFAERGFRELDSIARRQFAGHPVATAENQSTPRAGSIPPPPPSVPATPPVVQSPAPAQPVDDVVREMIAPPPDPAAGKVIRLKQDYPVVIGGRKFLIRAGDQFPLKKLSDGTVTFLANNEEVSVDVGLVTFTGKSQESPAEITKLARDELKKRYPGVFQEGSVQNDVFVARTEELKTELPEFFKNPRWPIELGDQLAEQEGWARADQPQEEKEPAAPKETPPPSTPQESPE